MNYKQYLPQIAMGVGCVAVAGVLLGYRTKYETVVPDDAVIATGSATGFGGAVEVEVAVSGSDIVYVKVLSQNETEGVGSVAVEQLPTTIQDSDNLNVDGVSGATISSTAIKEAVAAAITAAGLDPLDYMTAAASEKDYDVVIVGAGGAGLTAAVTAKQAGANVLVVEKMPYVGGNSLRAIDGMNAAETKYQEEQGITDSVEDLISDTMEGGEKLNDSDLVTAMAENSAKAIDWLDSIGVSLSQVEETGGTDHNFLHEPEDGSAVGPYIVSALENTCEKLGVDIRLNTEVTEILTDENGTVCGIQATDTTDGTSYTINAKSVIVTTGGFGANSDMLASYDSDLADTATTNHEGATGDGITMAEALGADTVDMDQIQLYPTVYQETALAISENMRSEGGILVNADGKRFCNEMLTDDEVSAAELEQTDAYAWLVFDQRLVDNYNGAQKYINNGIAVSGSTYKELAEAMGVDADTLAETMKNWSKMAAAGEDTDFGRTSGLDSNLSEAPYYAIKVAPAVHHTTGGLEINTDAQVLDAEGNVISALYAAGEVTGGVQGGNSLNGNSVCDFVVFGRIAGQNAAEYAAAKQ